ncbi:TRAP transporter permease [Oricola sp.]|uniref:TRAP transporter permease n=1 Tax=Oricola sp. TaxID=1979950 RepID=UPI0035126E26
MAVLKSRLLSVILGLLVAMTVAWVLKIPDRLGFALITQQVIAIVLGLTVAASFLSPRNSSPLSGWADLLLAAFGMASWFWLAWNFNDWMLTLAYRTPDMWIPGAIAIVITVEALRRAAGLTITMLVVLMLAYVFLGEMLPGVLQAESVPPTRTILFLYADSSAILGVVLSIIVGLVLPFIIFGKMMELVGGMSFFSDLSLALLGRWRGGPAKGACLASASFGMLSGSTVANILSTGIVTIPLMKRTGFKSHQAAAIEAVASNGGQIMPPVMGATAFIIAEFLQIPYSEVVFAALVPAVIYFLVLFVKIDAIAATENIAGLGADELPSLRDTLKGSWIFFLPLALLIYLLFFASVDPGSSALLTSVAILVLSLFSRQNRPRLGDVWRSVEGAGRESLPVILIGAGAGVVIGVMNFSGFAFQLTLGLTALAETYGLFIMLLMTALVAIILGMGMPTVAVYVVLVTIVAPTVVDMGVFPLGAHLFLFYFGIMSMITPPIALGSIVAAQVAGAEIWRTGAFGVRLGISAYLLPFLWVYNPALLLEGTTVEKVILFINIVAAINLLRASMLPKVIPNVADKVSHTALVIIAVFVGGATVWFGTESPISVAFSLLGFLPFVFGRFSRN